MKYYKRKSAFTELVKFCHLSTNNAFIEVTEWHNSEGFDVEVAGHETTSFSLTWGQFDALKKTIKFLHKQVTDK